jgi:hypothetical protein
MPMSRSREMKEFLFSAVVCCMANLQIKPVNEASIYLWVGKEKRQ